MSKLSTNTFQSVLDYLLITKNSNTINSWLLGINIGLLLFLLNNIINPSVNFQILLCEVFLFKILIFILFVWVISNVTILIIFSYKEKVLSLVIEDKFYRLKSFISYMDIENPISEKDLLETDMFNLYKLSENPKTQNVINEYVNKINDYRISIVKWSNKRFFIYRFVILISIPLLISAFVIVFYQFKFIDFCRI